MAGYTCAYGKIVDKNGREVDDGVLTVFRAPKSYTGENVCEISCHGGIYVTKKVLRLCIEQGAELAQRGEFTKRAFLNGKLSLTQAEGVMETISAQGEYALNSANLTKEGRLFRLISDMSRKFVTILGELAAWVDYPEEDLPEISEDNLRESLKNALAGLDKIIADHDSGMILKNGVDTVIAGKPNVGKSTLLSRVTNAEPKIANYHFTTLYPNLGVIYVADGVSFVMADIPGIIEGAADGVGLGHDFLRHIDRCRLLVHIVDVSGSEDRDPVDDFEKINEELRQYSPELAERPMLVAANKVDLLPPDSDNLERLRAHVEAKGYEFYTICAATTQGTRELMKTIAGKLAALPPVTIYEPEYVKPLAEAGDADELQIERYDDLWVVSGKWLQKLLNDINFDDYESRMYFDRQLRKSGLFDRLEEQGIEDGDTVSIYDFEFDYTK